MGEVVGFLAGLLAALGGEQELGEVTEGGGAAAGDAVGGEGAEDAGHRAVHVVSEGGSFSKRPISCSRSSLCSAGARGFKRSPWERQ